MGHRQVALLGLGTGHVAVEATLFWLRWALNTSTLGGRRACYWCYLPLPSSRMERPSNGLHVELAGIADVLKDCKRGFQRRMAAAYSSDLRCMRPRWRARIQAARGLEFCVHGIVVHLRLGNCIGYSLRESIPIDPFVAESPSSVAWYGQPSERQGH